LTTIEAQTQSIKRLLNLTISPERIWQELEEILTAPTRASGSRRSSSWDSLITWRAVCTNRRADSQSATLAALPEERSTRWHSRLCCTTKGLMSRKSLSGIASEQSLTEGVRWLVGSCSISAAIEFELADKDPDGRAELAALVELHRVNLVVAHADLTLPVATSALPPSTPPSLPPLLLSGDDLVPDGTWPHWRDPENGLSRAAH
jgi:hypothetical protein